MHIHTRELSEHVECKNNDNNKVETYNESMLQLRTLTEYFCFANYAAWKIKVRPYVPGVPCYPSGEMRDI